MRLISRAVFFLFAVLFIMGRQPRNPLYYQIYHIIMHPHSITSNVARNLLFRGPLIIPGFSA